MDADVERSCDVKLEEYGDVGGLFPLVIVSPEQSTTLLVWVLKLLRIIHSPDANQELLCLD